MLAIEPGAPAAPSRIRRLQQMLGVPETGTYDEGTQAMVEEFQRDAGLKVDRIAGPITWDRLWERHGRPWVARVDLPGVSELERDRKGAAVSYAATFLRSDVAEHFRDLVAAAASFGVVVTSAGGVRALDAPVSAGRSATSGHYLGRDHDLALPTCGMFDPLSDPFVVERAPDLGPRRWRVWARAETADLRTVHAVQWGMRHTVLVQARLIDFTALALEHGFAGIPARSSAAWWEDGAAPPANRHHGSTEVWHLSHRGGCVRGETLFGDELLALYPLERLKRSPPWEFRDRVFGVDGGWF